MLSSFNNLARPRKSRNKGLTLIELLVSMVIGLVLAIVASSTYLYSKQAYNTVSEVSQAEENGRFALTLLTRNIQSAGFNSLLETDQFPTAATSNKIRGCDFGMTLPTTPATAGNLNCQASTPAGSTRSASLYVTFETDAYTSSASTFQGFDCIGNRPITVTHVLPNGSAASPTFAVEAYFFVSTTNVQTAGGATTTMGQLSCSNGSSAASLSQPLIPGIHQLAITYLTPSATNEPSVAQVTNTAATIQSGGLWPRVTAVDLCVLTKSVQPSGNDTGSQATDCYGNVFTPPPGQTFRRFTSVVKLRNKT